MKVIDSKILVKVEKQTTYAEKAGGFVVPTDQDSRYEVAKVISVGEKVESIKIGDILYIMRGAGFEFSNEGEEYRVISIPDILIIKD